MANLQICSLLVRMSIIAALFVCVGSSWIIEEIPQRKYGPQALALSKEQHQKSVVDLSRKVWKSSLDGRYENDLSPNSVRPRSDKSKAKPHVGRRKDKTELKCKPIKHFSPNSGIPCRLRRDQTPMFVYFSFDDATTSWNIGFYRRLFAHGRENPNGCPIRATFFNSHENTEYDLLNELYDSGHELASHSVSHKGPSTWWSINATKQDWVDEIVGQRDNIHEQTTRLLGQGVPKTDIRGMRAPFLAIGGDTQFQMLEEQEFLYDSSIPNNNKKPTWPFTLHDPSAMNGPICRGPYCPTAPHSIWEVAMNVYYMDRPGQSLPCSMVDGCRPEGGEDGAIDFLRKNFLRHYHDKHKVPFGINMHAAWFAFDGYIDGMDAFIRELLTYDDVYIVPISNILEWMQKPRTIKNLLKSKFGCTERL